MDQRPTSPHLTIYRPQITSVLSILHRITGVALMVGTALLVTWLFVAAYQPGQYSGLHELMSSLVGRVLLIGWTLAFYYHLANGVRHLFWDMGKGFTIPQTTRSGIMVLVFTVIMTGASWCPVLFGATH
jgi:succinate dehydrogenase / fumarate reductase, cytochrome b subunit